MTQEDKDFLMSIESIRRRMTGRTTQMVDEFIQKLYKNEGEWVEIYDHYPSRNADRMIMEKIIRRMQFEHPQDKLEIDKLNNKLKLTWSQRDGLWAEIDEYEKLKASYKNEN